MTKTERDQVDMALAQRLHTTYPEGVSQWAAYTDVDLAPGKDVEAECIVGLRWALSWHYQTDDEAFAEARGRVPDRDASTEANRPRDLYHADRATRQMWGLD